jgi:hypothetical protein
VSTDDAALPLDNDAAPADATAAADVLPPPPKVTALRAAHDAKLHRAGKFAGQGYPHAWIADRFGVTRQTVDGWSAEPAFAEGFATEEGRMARAADMALTKIALSLGQLVDTAIANALDPAAKDSAADRRYLIDKVLTPMTVQHNVNTHAADPRFFEPIATALTRLAALPAAKVPLLIEGSVAAEEYGAAAVPAALAPEEPTE